MQDFKQKFANLLHRHPWALQSLIALFLLIGVMASQSLASPSDWPWPNTPPVRDPGPIHNLQIKSANAGPATPPTSVFKLGDSVKVTWDLDVNDASGHPIDYTGWVISLQWENIEKGYQEHSFTTIGIPATNKSYTFNIPNQVPVNPDINGGVATMPTVSMQSVPNPYDRAIFAILWGPWQNNTRQFNGWDITKSFAVFPWRITQPVGGAQYTKGDMLDINWSTVLNGPINIYAAIANPNGSVSHMPLTGLDVSAKSWAWKVGYMWQGGRWVEISNITNRPVRIYFAPTDSTLRGNILPDGFYQGFDGDLDFNDDDILRPFTIKDAVSQPSITSINPTHGPAAGGTSVTITGANLQLVTEVRFDNTPATNLVISPLGTSIFATSPAHTAGKVSITVTTSDGQTATLPSAFTYDAELLPQITGINPTSGKIGDEVILTGINFGDIIDPLNAVLFQSTDGLYNTDSTEIVSWSDTQIIVLVPTTPAGQYSVSVYLHSVGHQSNSVGFTVISSNPLSATYYSSHFDLTNDGQQSGRWRVTQLNSLATVSSPLTTDSTVRFSLGFFKKVGDSYTNLAPIGSGGFDSEGYLVITNDNQDHLEWIAANFSWFAQVTHIRFRIEMSTSDIGDPAKQPWVQSVNLTYTPVNVADTIGFIKFKDEDTNPNAYRFALSKGATVQVLFDVVPTLADYNGTVQLALGNIKNKSNDQTDTTITGAFVSPNAAGQINLSGAPVQVTIQFTASQTTADGLYQFVITGADVADPNLTLIPKENGELIVGGVIPGEQFHLSIDEGQQTVGKGGTVVYHINVNRVSTYTGTIALTTNIQSPTVFGTDITSAVFSPNSITFDNTDVIVPGGPVLTKTATLTIAASANPILLDTSKTFTVTGTDGGLPTPNVATATSNLTIAANTIILSVTIPLEPDTKPQDAEKYARTTHPNFSLRVYASNSVNPPVAQAVGFHTNTNNQANVVIPMLPNGTYTVYARTTRHLWKKSTDPAVLTIPSTSYNLVFPALPAGNLDENNTINVLDYSAFTQNIGQSGDDLLGDINNDNGISSVDYNFFINFFNGFWKYMMNGDPLPDFIP